MKWEARYPGSVWKSALKQLCHKKTASNQLLSHSLLKILITKLWEIASHLHMWQVTERRSGRRMDGDSRGTVTDWSGYPVGTNSSRARAWEGKGNSVFAFQFRPHTGFLLDDRWHASHPAHCRYHSAQPSPSPLYLTSPLHLATASSQFYPLPTNITTAATTRPTYIHTLSISLSACLPFQHWSSSQVC